VCRQLTPPLSAGGHNSLTVECSSLATAPPSRGLFITSLAPGGCLSVVPSPISSSPPAIFRPATLCVCSASYLPSRDPTAGSTNVTPSPPIAPAALPGAVASSLSSRQVDVDPWRSPRPHREDHMVMRTVRSGRSDRDAQMTTVQPRVMRRMTTVQPRVMRRMMSPQAFPIASPQSPNCTNRPARDGHLRSEPPNGL